MNLENINISKDIKNVITVKTNQWLHDIKMNPNLRPKTLFSMEKFDTYLNEYASTQPQKDEIVGAVLSMQSTVMLFIALSFPN